MPHSKFNIRSRMVIMNGGKLLVVKHAPTSEYYALPGGHLEAGETPLECASREIVEELGVEPSVGRLLYVHAFRDRREQDTLEFIFEALNGREFVNLEGKERTHAFELAEVLWIDQKNNLNLLPKSLAGDFKAGKILSNEVRYTKG